MATTFIEWLGRFHPLFVHLPIGFLVLLAVLEWLALKPKWKELATATRVILALTIPASVVSVLCGWFLAADGGYDAKTLFWHRWLGTAVAVAAVLLWVLRQHGWLRAYRRSLVVTLALLTVASHFGGSLTHGDDFLALPKSKKSKPGAAAGSKNDQPLYAVAIQPLLDKYCVQCHGEKKSKGGLRLDTAEHIFKPGDSGESIVRGNADESLLFQRILLPMDSDEHMPPDGKPQPGEVEIELLRWWINAGADTAKSATELNAPESILKITPHD